MSDFIFLNCRLIGISDTSLIVTLSNSRIDQLSTCNTRKKPWKNYRLVSTRTEFCPEKKRNFEWKISWRVEILMRTVSLQLMLPSFLSKKLPWPANSAWPSWICHSNCSTIPSDLITDVSFPTWLYVCQFFFTTKVARPSIVCQVAPSTRLNSFARSTTCSSNWWSQQSSVTSAMGHN